jgi:flagella basal body P-ring formation protein FlgA
MPDTTAYIVSVRPAPGHEGPTLVSDDPALVRIVMDAIRRRYVPDPRRVIDLLSRSDPEGAA